jgi:hypothetical protein
VCVLQLVLASPENWYYEMAAMAVLVVYGVTNLVGGAVNDRIGRRWAAWAADPGNALHRQFSIVGCGADKYRFRGGPLTKESSNEWMCVTPSPRPKPQNRC